MPEPNLILTLGLTVPACHFYNTSTSVTKDGRKEFIGIKGSYQELLTDFFSGSASFSQLDSAQLSFFDKQ